MTPTPTAVGLDPSLTGTGIAHSATGRCVRVGRTDVTTLPLLTRLGAVDSLVGQILDEVARPDLVVIETPAFSRAGGGQLERSALWWLIVRGLRYQGVPVVEVSIQHRMRYATGKGAATKGAVIDAVARRWPQFVTCGDDNLADAAVLAAMGADRLGAPLATVPATHRAALDKVDWPPPPPPVETFPTPPFRDERIPRDATVTTVDPVDGYEPPRPPSPDAWATTGGL